MKHVETQPLRLLRPREAMRRIGVGQTTFFLLAKTDPSFPKACKLSDHGRAIGYCEAELDAWIKGRLSKRNVADAALA
jgi:prophage regulatory protein